MGWGLGCVKLTNLSNLPKTIYVAKTLDIIYFVKERVPVFMLIFDWRK